MLRYLLITLSILLVGVSGLATAQSKTGVAKEQQQEIFRDDFTGVSLRPEWRMLNEDSDRWTFVDNDFLLIITSHSDKGRKNVLSYSNEDLPGSYSVVLKIVEPPDRGSQDVAFSLRRDQKNGLIVYFHGDGEFGFSKELRGERNTIDKRVGKIGRQKPLYLRLHRRGIEYTASWSLDGNMWSEVGTHLFLDLKGRHLYFSAANWQSSGTPEVGVRFDFIEIKRQP